MDKDEHESDPHVDDRIERFNSRDLKTNADQVLEAASRDGRAVVLGDDGEPDLIVSVSKRELKL